MMMMIMMIIVILSITMERIINEYIMEIMGVKGRSDTIDIIEQKRLQ
jgi:hypothetical protein